MDQSRATLSPTLSVRLLGTGSVEVGPAVSTAEVASRAALPYDGDELARRTGIDSRHWAAPEASMGELGARALAVALERAGLDAVSLRRIILVTSTGGDELVPAAANHVAHALGVHQTCDTFDINNACMGFLTGFDVGARSVATGLAPVAVVVVELLSRYLTASDPRPYAVLADAAVAVVLGPGREGEGVLASYLRNDPSQPRAVRLTHPGVSHSRETIQFSESHRAISDGARSVIGHAASAVLGAARLPLSDVEWVLPHQPNGKMLDEMIAALGLSESRVVRVVDAHGSVGAASIPLSLDRLMQSGRVRAGDRVLMVGAGAGVSYGAVLLRVGG